MKALTQTTFIQGFPSVQSRRAYELQHLKARSHVALVTHQRHRPEAGSKDQGVSGKRVEARLSQTINPFHNVRLSPSALSTKHLFDEINPSNTYMSTAPPINDPIEPAEREAVFKYHFVQGPIEGWRARQDAQKLDCSSDGGVPKVSFENSNFEMPYSLRISLSHEGFPDLRTYPLMCIPNSGDHRIGSTIDFYAQVLNLGNDTVCYIFNVANVYASFLDIIQDEYSSMPDLA